MYIDDLTLDELLDDLVEQGKLQYAFVANEGSVKFHRKARMNGNFCNSNMEHTEHRGLEDLLAREQEIKDAIKRKIAKASRLSGLSLTG